MELIRRIYLIMVGIKIYKAMFPVKTEMLTLSIHK